MYNDPEEIGWIDQIRAITLSHASSSALASDGFDDWHNSYLIQTHENLEKHRNAM